MLPSTVAVGVLVHKSLHICYSGWSHCFI